MNLIEDITQAQHSAQFMVRHIVEAHSWATQSYQTAVEELMLFSMIERARKLELDLAALLEAVERKQSVTV